jgi:CheY-like chemotaxis protein
MIAAAQDATHVVSRLSDFYRPATGDEIRVAVDVNDLVAQAVTLTTPKWKGASQAEGVQITIETDLGEVPPIAGNACELREVLTNLIFNAVDAMPRGGKITISSCHRHDRVLVCVSDCGIGMSESERERCLEPFFTTKGERGTGLGLSVVYGIVQRHGGAIEIESKKGRGTTFTIVLPATHAAAAPTPDVAEKLEQPLRILVADDQEIICELIAEYLTTDGHEAVCAFDGLKALQEFRRGSFDLVITDQSMPGMNGEQLGAAIAECAPQTPVILLTGFGDEMRATGNHPAGIDLVLSKPVTADDLRRAIQDVIAIEDAVADKAKCA